VSNTLEIPSEGNSTRKVGTKCQEAIEILLLPSLTALISWEGLFDGHKFRRVNPAPATDLLDPQNLVQHLVKYHPTYVIPRNKLLIQARVESNQLLIETKRAQLDRAATPARSRSTPTNPGSTGVMEELPVEL
jgi:hypothetical protein